MGALIRPREDNAAFRSAPASYAISWFGWRILWDTANRRLVLILDLTFALSRSAPVAPQKAAGSIENFDEPLVIVHTMAVRFTKIECLLIQTRLNRIEHSKNGLIKSILRDRCLLPVITASQHDLVL